MTVQPDMRNGKITVKEDMSSPESFGLADKKANRFRIAAGAHK